MLAAHRNKTKHNNATLKEKKNREKITSSHFLAMSEIIHSNLAM